MFIADFWSKPWRWFRQKLTSVDPEYKGNFGLEITAQSADDGTYTTTNKGDEQGWQYTPGSSGRGFGSWSQAVPAIYDSEAGTVQPIKDKTLAVDTDYPTQSISSSAGDSNNTIRVAEIDGTKIPGVILTCLNHNSQEKIFIPMGEGGGA